MNCTSIEIAKDVSLEVHSSPSHFLIGIISDNMNIHIGGKFMICLSESERIKFIETLEYFKRDYALGGARFLCFEAKELTPVDFTIEFDFSNRENVEICLNVDIEHEFLLYGDFSLTCHTQVNETIDFLNSIHEMLSQPLG